MVVALMGDSEPYKLGVAKLQADTQAATLLGTPIKAGYPRGSMDMQGQSGEASYNFSVTGPKASGQVSLRATRDFDQWTVNSLKLKVDGQNSIVDIVAPGSEPVRLDGYRLTSPGDDAVKTSFTTADKKITLAIAYRRHPPSTRAGRRSRRRTAAADFVQPPPISGRAQIRATRKTNKARTRRL